MNTLLQDLRFGFRVLAKSPAFSLVAILTLGLGIGANSAIFSAVDRLLIRSLPVKDPQQLVLINSVSVSPYFVSNSFSYLDFADYRAQNQVFSELLAFSTTSLELKMNDRVERVPSEFVSGNYFAALGINASLGRTFSPAEGETPGAYPVVVVSERFWRNRYGSDPKLIDRTIVVNDVSLTVVGVAPAGFGGMMIDRPAEMWVPVMMHPQLGQSQFVRNRGDRWMQLMGRLRPGLSPEQAEAGMDILAQQIKDANTPPGTVTRGLPFSEQHIRLEPGGRGISLLRKQFSTPLKLLMAVVGLVLLIACANVASLLLARAVSRRREMGVRLALGASRWRLVRQLLTESVMLALAGGAFGLLLAPWLISLLLKFHPLLQRAQSTLGNSLDPRVLTFTVCATVLAGVIFGLAPAWKSAKADLVPALKAEGSLKNRSERQFNLRSSLVVAQIALALVVLIGAGLCVKSLRALFAIDPGYQTESVLFIPLDLDDKKYDEARGREFHREIVERIRSLRGVEEVSDGLVVPLSGSRMMNSIFADDRQPLPGEEMAFDANAVGPRYHETMGIKILQGRGFTEQDRAGAPGVVIINETMARRIFPGENAVGKRLRLGTNRPSLEIIGVAGDIKHHELTEAPLPHFDLPSLQRNYNSYTNLLIRTNGSATALIPAVRRELRALDAAAPVFVVKTMAEQIGDALAALKLASTLTGLFGVLALLLAALGLYGAMAYSVSSRTREIGIRMALGAQRRDVLRLVVKQGMLITALGTAVGLAAIQLLIGLTRNLPYGVSTTEPMTFGFMVLLLTIVALLASYLPARRAAKADPIVALRSE